MRWKMVAMARSRRTKSPIEDKVREVLSVLSVLSVLAGEMSCAKAPRWHGGSATLVCKWHQVFSAGIAPVKRC